ncbi:hypothetical protein EW145_g3787 [Phellinidium pouzarii]|uniref:Uncharacterized protein n=1 Tax=Phellinidium pouzarii TaxID=167371 RepID=A0A4S4L647_9AGAM|nr:hypothetical protein EW145_g3787 [Phellinidium pouzarii]
MKRSTSQSSASDYSDTFDDSEFPSYEDLFYRPPMPDNPDNPNCPQSPAQVVLDNRVCEDENEGTIRELLNEMRDWILEHPSEVGRRLQKPLPPSPVASDDELPDSAPATPRYGKFLSEDDEDHRPTPKPSISALRAKVSTSTSSSQKSLTCTAFPISRRRFVDVPQSPLSEAFMDSPCPSPRLPRAPIRTRSSSMTLCGPSLLTARSETNLRQHRPPSLKAPFTSLGPDHIFLKPGFNKSFSAPNTPTAGEFMQMQANPKRHPSLHHVHSLPYSTRTHSGHLAPGDFSSRAVTLSRWSLSTSAQDDAPGLLSNQEQRSSQAEAEVAKKGLTRSASRFGLSLSFAKFDIAKFIPFPIRASSRKRLIIQGVKSGDTTAVQSVRQWCEVFGAIDRLSQKPNGEIHIHYRNRAVANRPRSFSHILRFHAPSASLNRYLLILTTFIHPPPPSVLLPSIIGGGDPHNAKLAFVLLSYSFLLISPRFPPFFSSLVKSFLATGVRDAETAYWLYAVKEPEVSDVLECLQSSGYADARLFEPAHSGMEL